MSGQKDQRPKRSDFLRLCDRSSEELTELFVRANGIREIFRPDFHSTSLRGKRVAFIWDGEGFRNRAAFELGVASMGGIGVEIPGRLGERETVDDLARYLDNWFDAIVVRTPRFENLVQLAAAATAPVLNARTRHNHPCEILGDLAFARSIRGDLNDLRVVFIGDATNLCHSWCEAAAALAITVIQVCPAGFEVDHEWWRRLVPKPGGEFHWSQDLLKAVSGADIVYTDCWPSAVANLDRENIGRLFAPLQITAAVLDRTKPDTLFLPCPPVTRGEEVSADAMESDKCRVYEAKEWLLHAQNALLEETLS